MVERHAAPEPGPAERRRRCIRVTGAAAAAATRAAPTQLGIVVRAGGRGPRRARAVDADVGGDAGERDFERAARRRLRVDGSALRLFDDLIAVKRRGRGPKVRIRSPEHLGYRQDAEHATKSDAHVCTAG